MGNRYVAEYNVLEKKPESEEDSMSTFILETVERRFSAESDESARVTSRAYGDHIASAASEYYGDKFGGVDIPEITKLEGLATSE